MAAKENRTGINEMPNNPELPDLFRVSNRELALQLRSHSVARVVTYDPATQTADLSVEILQIVKDHFTPATAVNPNPVSTQTPVLLQNIKVYWPRTNAGSLTLPLAPGDTGELHVQDRSIDIWRKTGVPSDPVSAFVHMLGDSTFHPGLAPDTNPITPPTSLTAAVLEGPLVFLGRLAESPLMLGDQVASAFTVYTNAVDAAFVTWGGTIPPTPASNGVFLGAIGAANVILGAAIVSWLSAKSFTE